MKVGRLVAELQEMAPKGTRRISGNPHANGGVMSVPLSLPDFREYAAKVEKPGVLQVSSTATAGEVSGGGCKEEHDELPGVRSG